MNEAASPPGSTIPHTRALRQVVVLNEEIGYEVRRIMGLKETDYAALAVLMRDAMGPTELARALHITSAATTAVVDRLVRAGHAVREPHPQDRRRMIIRAVEASRELTMQHVYPMMDMVETELDKLDPAGRDAVLQFLTGMIAALQSYRDQLKARPPHVRAGARDGTATASPEAPAPHGAPASHGRERS